jgi:hypothetical protein
MAKYAHNLFNAAKISFANETWLVSKELGIDGNQVMALVAQSAEGDVEPSLWYPRWFPLRRQLSTQGYRSFR